MITPDILGRVTAECIHFVDQGEWAAVRSELAPCVREASVAQVRDDQGIFIVVAKALEFPEYFGRNWDALDECLRDLTWLRASGYVLALTNATRAWKVAPRTLGDLVEAWLFCAREWASESVPFHLVFVW